VIRVATLEEFPQPEMVKLCKTLYSAFGIGAEYAGEVRSPDDATDPADAKALLEGAPAIRAYADDKILYITRKKLKDRQLPTGTAPTHGFAQYTGSRALISVAGVKDIEAGMKLISRHALHQIGHLWELHHCLDPRCSMYPPWTPSFLTGDSIFCSFCREKSEQKLRLAKS
jgi:archaemetzincin